MAYSDTGCGPVVIESDEDKSSQKELDLENDFNLLLSIVNSRYIGIIKIKKILIVPISKIG